jgi:hypothetical protein
MCREKFVYQSEIYVHSIIQYDNDLIEMIGRCNLGVLLPQFNGQFRITLQAYSPGFLREVEQCEHFACHFKDQGGVIERKSFRDSGFGDAIFAYFFDVHDFLICARNIR